MKESTEAELKHQVQSSQQRIEDLIKQVARLEIMLEMAGDQNNKGE